MEIKLIKGDITECNTDAIVNAANRELRWGSGVCGAIFRAAGGSILESECKKKSPINTGEAVLTNGYNLKAKYIIHAVGPIYHDDSDSVLLYNAYYNSLRIADEYKLNSIAFPSISTGVYGYPKDKAAIIAIKAIKEFKANYLNEVVLVCFDNETYDLYKNILS